MVAEAGLTVQQIKCVTGHKSDEVVQGYIDNTNAMRLIGSRSLQLEGSIVQQPAKKPRTDDAQDLKESGNGNTYNITINLGDSSAINAPINLFSHEQGL